MRFRRRYRVLPPGGLALHCEKSQFGDGEIMGEFSIGQTIQQAQAAG